MRPAKKSESYDHGLTQLPMLFSISCVLWKGESGKADPVVKFSFVTFCQLPYDGIICCY